MGFLKFGQVIFLIISLSFFTQIAYKYHYHEKKKKLPKNRKEIHEVIMFSDDRPSLMKSKHSKCSINVSMDRLLFYLNSPQKTLDVCMYVLTNMDITNAMLKVHYRGVKIRLIIDADMAFASGSHVRRLERHGIPVRWRKSTNLMHHKFCLIDASTPPCHNLTPLVMTGSLNWTNNALHGNWENVIVTSQVELVNQYRNEFESLWILFKPII